MWCPNLRCDDAGLDGAPFPYDNEVTTCPTCGATLVDTPPPPWHRPAEDDALLCELAVPHDSLLPVLKAMLESSGVRYFIKNEGVQSLIGIGGLVTGYNPVTGAPVLVVGPDDYDAATEILREVEQAYRTPPAPDSDGESAT